VRARDFDMRARAGSPQENAEIQAVTRGTRVARVPSR
jgi:hypothetical protein